MNGNVGKLVDAKSVELFTNKEMLIMLMDKVDKLHEKLDCKLDKSTASWAVGIIVGFILTIIGYIISHLNYHATISSVSASSPTLLFLFRKR